jgi:hypothetical protein
MSDIEGSEPDWHFRCESSSERVSIKKDPIIGRSKKNFLICPSRQHTSAAAMAKIDNNRSHPARRSTQNEAPRQ